MSKIRVFETFSGIGAQNKALKNANKTKKWINHELKIQGKKLEDILLLTVDGEDKIKTYLK